jgi:transcriptional regulator with XRE-family HTH domain
MPRQRGKAYDTMSARNGLQGRLLEYMRQRNMTLAQVATQTGVKTTTIYMWFKDSNRALSSNGLQRIADIMGITFDRALAEAGGKTGEERVAEQGERNKRHLPRGERLRQAGSKGGTALREKYQNGYEMAPAHRAAISEAKKGTALNLDKTTLRGRAQSMLGGLRRQGSTPVEAEAAAIERLKANPYRITDARIARALIRPKRRRRTDWYRVIEWRCERPPKKWGEGRRTTGGTISDLLGRDPESLRVGFHQFLQEFTT